MLSRRALVALAVAALATAAPAAAQSASGPPDSGAPADGPDASKLDKSQDSCMLCQFVMERVIDGVNAAGLVPRVRGGGRQDRTGWEGELNEHPAYVETASRTLPEGEPTNEHLAAAHAEETGEPPVPTVSQREELERSTEHAREGDELDERQRARQERRETERAAAAAAHAEDVRSYQNDPATSSLAPHLLRNGPVRFGPGGPAPPLDNSQPMNGLEATERQLFAEVYKSMDLTLNAVCEQQMPNEFYGACERIFAMQGVVVNLVTRSFNPQNLCARVDMCDDDSYLTKFSIHTPKPRVDDDADGK